MAENGLLQLPETDFVLFSDERASIHFLAGRLISLPGLDDPIDDQHDRFPGSSREISTLRSEERLLLERELGPPIYPYSLFRDRRVRFNPDLMSSESYFYGPPPQHKIHFDRLMDFACEPFKVGPAPAMSFPSSYCLVSSTWKAIIEFFEPGVHEFFNHKMEFCDYTMSNNYYIFRECADIDCAIRDTTRIDNRGPSDFARKRSDRLKVVVNRSLLRGRHWVRDGSVHEPIISRQLAERLIPLLPTALECDRPFSFQPILFV